MGLGWLSQPWPPPWLRPCTGRYQIILLGDNRGTCVNYWSRVAARERDSRESNLWPVDRKSSLLTTMPLKSSLCTTQKTLSKFLHNCHNNALHTSGVTSYFAPPLSAENSSSPSVSLRWLALQFSSFIWNKNFVVVLLDCNICVLVLFYRKKTYQLKVCLA